MAALHQERLVGRRLDLRAAFLDGKTSASEVELEDLRVAAECAVSTQRDALEAARGGLARAQALMDAGVISQQDVRRAQRRLAEAEAALRLAQLELGVLADKGGR
jgi:multidrug resistance efflux pump